MTIARKIIEAKEQHDERHRISGLGIVLADSIRYLNGEHWDSLVSDKSFFIGRPYLDVLESHGPTNLKSRVGLLYRGATPVAAIHAQFVDVSGNQLTHKKPLGILRERVLVAGDLMSTGQHGVAIARGEDPAAIWPGVAEALYRLRRGDKLAGQTDVVVIKDFEGIEEGSEALKRFDYRPLQTQPNMVLEIPPAWKTYADYLASLNSKYRKGMLDVEKRIEQAGYRVEAATDLEPMSKRIHELYHQVQAHADIRFFELPESFLPALARISGDRFSCIIIRKNSDIAGFVTTLRDGNSTVGYFVGFDRQINQDAPIYFRLLQAVVHKAIENGSSRLSLGRTALEPKARIGALPVPTSVWIRHRIPAMNLMVKRVLGLIPHDEPPLRNPFK